LRKRQFLAAVHVGNVDIKPRSFIADITCMEERWTAMAVHLPDLSAYSIEKNKLPFKSQLPSVTNTYGVNIAAVVKIIIHFVTAVEKKSIFHHSIYE